MTARRPLRIVTTGLAVTYPFGGVFWDYIQYPLGREPEIKVSLYCRHRTTAGAAVNCYAGITFES